MKKSKFIKKALNSTRNTVFTTAEQIEVAIEIFEGLGMLPPMSDETISQHDLSTSEAMLDSVIYDFKWDNE